MSKKNFLTYCKYSKQPQHTALHIVVIQQYIGEMRGQKGVNTTRRTHQTHVRIKNGRAQWAGKNTGQINEGNPARTVHHLQR